MASKAFDGDAGAGGGGDGGDDADGEVFLFEERALLDVELDEVGVVAGIECGELAGESGGVAGLIEG